MQRGVITSNLSGHIRHHMLPWAGSAVWCSQADHTVPVHSCTDLAHTGGVVDHVRHRDHRDNGHEVGNHQWAEHEGAVESGRSGRVNRNSREEAESGGDSRRDGDYSPVEGHGDRGRRSLEDHSPPGDDHGESENGSAARADGESRPVSSLTLVEAEYISEPLGVLTSARHRTGLSLNSVPSSWSTALRRSSAVSYSTNLDALEDSNI